MDTVNELKELKRRVEEMKKNPSVCIPIENIFEIIENIGYDKLKNAE